MKDLYVLTDRYGDVELLHAPDRNKALQAWEAAIQDSTGNVREILKGNGACRRFLEGTQNKIIWGSVALQAVSIKECK